MSGVRLTLAALAAACLVAVRPAGATTGPPDTFGYSWTDQSSGCSTGIPGFGAGAVTATAVAPATMLGPFPLGFTMPYYGQPVNQVWISPAGYVSFTAQPSTPYTNQTIPSTTPPNDLIAAFWCSPTTADLPSSPSGMKRTF